MSAALEGTLEGIPSAGISLCNNNVESNCEASKVITRALIERMLKSKSDTNLCLNVNIPDVPLNRIKGVHICRQGRGNWKRITYEEHKDRNGDEFLWLTGEFENFEKGKTDNDLWALNASLHIIFAYTCRHDGS